MNIKGILSIYCSFAYLDLFVHELEPITGFEVFKEDLQILEESCALADRISQLANLIGEGSICIKLCDPPNYAPMKLDSMGTCERHHQPDKGGRNNQNDNSHPTYFVCGKKGQISRECYYNLLRSPILM